MNEIQIQRLQFGAALARYPEYAGMSYEQASREADRVLEREGWFGGFLRLESLRALMHQHAMAAAIRGQVSAAVNSKTD